MSDLDRREMLMQAMEAAEEGTLEAPEEKEIDVPETDPIVEESKSEESNEIQAVEADNEGITEISAEHQSEESDEAQEEKPVTRPSTWKKEYVQIWDKMEKGEQISKEDFTKFAEYANQRESEYQRGVSVYKAEAERAKKYADAIAPFEQDLARRNIDPQQYVPNLIKIGRAHV